MENFAMAMTQSQLSEERVFSNLKLRRLMTKINTKKEKESRRLVYGCVLCFSKSTVSAANTTAIATTIPMIAMK